MRLVSMLVLALLVAPGALAQELRINAQCPAINSDVIGNMSADELSCACFGKGQSCRPATSTNTDDRIAWESIKDTTSVAMLEAFVARFPQSGFAPFAAARIGELRMSVGAPVVVDDGGAFRRIADFVAYEYLGERLTNAAGIFDNYGSRVRYFGTGGMAPDAIVRDKLAYGKRWPVHVYSLDSDTLSIVTLGADRYAARFEYAFVLSNGGRTVSGRGNGALSLDLADGMPRIYDEAGDVLSRVETGQ